MIEGIGGRRMCVTTLDPALMRDRHEIRAALGGRAARRVADRAQNRIEVERIERHGRSVLNDGRKAISSGTIHEMIRQNEAFHTLLYQASGNPPLPRTAEAHWRFPRRALGEALRRAEPPREMWRQHVETLSAVPDANANGAERLPAGHVERAAVPLAAALSGQEGRNAEPGDSLANRSRCPHP